MVTVRKVVYVILTEPNSSRVFFNDSLHSAHDLLFEGFTAFRIHLLAETFLDSCCLIK